MMQGLGEVLIGYRADADVGPLVMLAPAACLPKSTATGACGWRRSTFAEANANDRRSRGAESACGYRGKPAGDLEALPPALVALSQLAIADGPAIAEAEVNPLIVKPKGEGVVAVDAWSSSRRRTIA